MSKDTTQLRYILDSEEKYPPSEGELSVTNILASYPLYIENYKDITSGQTINRRDELNQKILDRYYFRQIGFETVDKFLFMLKRKMNEIMKYYNQMYKSVDTEFNPLDNFDETETFTHNISGTGETTSTSNGDNLNVGSDTPNEELTEVDIKANKWASSTNYDKTTNSGNVNSTDSRTETYTRNSKGSSKGYTFSQNIDQWRNIMINVDMQVVEELNTLFLNKW